MEYKLLKYGATVYSGYAFKTSELAPSGDYPVIKIGNLVGCTVDYSKTEFISRNHISNKHDKYFLNNKDVLIAMTGQGSVGRVAQLRKKTQDKLLLNQRVGKFICNENLNNDYLFYVLSSKFYQDLLFNLGYGSGQPNLSPDTILNVSIPFPDYKTQQKIASILSSLDDKIELNNKINENLEQQAQALFKSWFIDFEPFGGKMPDRWKVGKLSEVLELKKDTIQAGEDNSLPYLPIDLIPIKSLALNDVRPNEEALSSLLRFNENDILIGAMRVYFHRVAIAPFNGITRTTCFVLKPFIPEYLSYGLLTCNQDLAIDYAQKTSKGSTMPYAVWEGGLGDYEIPIPDKVAAKKFNDLLIPIIEQIKKSYFENNNLKQLRDTLLPKLMNGKIEVD